MVGISEGDGDGAGDSVGISVVATVSVVFFFCVRRCRSSAYTSGDIASSWCIEEDDAADADADEMRFVSNNGRSSVRNDGSSHA